ncbi:MAG: DotI/IcmL/TraM family protein [Gammaproteobacteria bacterium]|nr:DotI/IcmL/TraM family protein [Gammaproteobacteria bacterium]
MKHTDALKMIFERNAFYRRMHFLALAAFLLSLIVIITLIWVVYTLVRNPTKPLYFASDRVGRLIQVVPVTVPNMSNAEVMNWTINALQKSFSMDFVNYRSQLQSSQKYFTTYGWTNFMNSLKSNNNLVALTQRKMVFSAKVIDQPTIVTQGILGGAYAWRFNMRMLVNYWIPPFDEKSKFANPLDVSVIVQRQEIIQSDNGLGIVQVIARMPTSTNQTQEISGVSTGGT